MPKWPIPAGIGNNVYLYCMVNVQMTYLLLVFVMKYVYINIPMPVMSTHKFLDNHPIVFFALFKIHENIEPMIPGNTLSANLSNSCNRAFNLFFIHSLAQPFLSLVVVLSDAVVDTLGPPSRASIRTPRTIPKAVKINSIVIPCSLKRVLILSPSVLVSLSKNLVIDSLI